MLAAGQLGENAGQRDAERDQLNVHAREYKSSRGFDEILVNKSEKGIGKEADGCLCRHSTSTTRVFSASVGTRDQIFLLGLAYLFSPLKNIR